MFAAALAVMDGWNTVSVSRHYNGDVVVFFQRHHIYSQPGVETLLLNPLVEKVHLPVPRLDHVDQVGSDTDTHVELAHPFQRRQLALVPLLEVTEAHGPSFVLQRGSA